MWRFVVLGIFVVLVGCDDRDEINESEAVFELIDTSYDESTTSGEGGITLKFRNMETDDNLEWKGRIPEGIRHLERLDVGSCYRKPLRAPEEVSCAEH